MLLEYKSRNKYGYTTLAVEIDTERKTATLYHGAAAPLHPMKKATAVFIRQLFAAYAENPNYTVKEI